MFGETDDMSWLFTFFDGGLVPFWRFMDSIVADLGRHTVE
jgi:hypothetical protein